MSTINPRFDIVAFSLKHRAGVIVLFLFLIGLGSYSVLNLSVDAFPDTTPVQVQINTVAPSLNPLELEVQVTRPVEIQISGMPGLEEVRSISKFGLSQVVATFRDEVNILDARQLILERINGLEFPPGIDPPKLGPIATGLGEVFHYTMSSEDPQRSLADIRTLHDWVIKPEMNKVPGVAEVNSWGGFELQYQVVVEPKKLIEFGLSLPDIFRALQANNANVGGGQIVSSGQSILVHGKGRVSNIEEIAAIVIQASQGTPVRIGDIATVQEGHEIRRGAVSAQGQGEVVLGLCFMLMGENSQQVTQELKAQLNRIQAFLPEDLKIEVVYDRTDLVDAVITTVSHNLWMGAGLVVLILFLILGDFRAGIAVALAIPLALLFAFIGMYEFSIAASLLSLGAMDFGILVDGSVVMTDVHLKGLKEDANRAGRALSMEERIKSIVRSSREVIRPTVFGMGIIMVVFLPVLTLEGIEGKMFKPMAWTFIFALLAALLIALLLTPIFSLYLLPARPLAKPNRVMGWLSGAYAFFLGKVLRFRGFSMTVVAVLMMVLIWQGSRLGGEFMPKLSEGSLVVNVIRLAGVSIEESVRYNSQIERYILGKFPREVDQVWSRIGTAEVATDPMGTELTDIFIKLHPRSAWQKATSQADLVAKMDLELKKFPGLNMVFTQPIEMRMNEMISGIRSDVGIKILGDDLEKLVDISDAVQAVLVNLEGSADVSGDQITGQTGLSIEIDSQKMARLGVSTEDVLGLVAANGNVKVGDIFVGQRSFPLVVRLPDRFRQEMDAWKILQIPTGDGRLISLAEVAHIFEDEGPSTIHREWGRRLIKVQCNVRGRDVTSFVAEAQAAIAEKVNLPEGYILEWGGQYQQLQRSNKRLMLVVPLTLLLVFLGLLWSLRNVFDVLAIYSGIPFAALGGVLALHLRDMPFSVSAAVGFIALSGIAVLNGQLLVSALRRNHSDRSLISAIVHAAKSRLLPVLATAITDMLGFLPMALSVGVGAEVQRPLATVVIGGVLTSSLLTLFILPVILSFKKNGK